MTFYCKNLEIGTDQCRKLNSECIPGRPGCVLEGRVAISEELQARIDKLEEERAERIKNKQNKN
ncbi:MAG: hypothetical protein OEL66_04140 [Desulfobulbaceae bacterium]|nr:hypothetical protein [Desulfobulbaceae bacterium]